MSTYFVKLHLSLVRGAHGESVCSCSYASAFSKVMLEVDVVAMMEMLGRTAFMSRSPLLYIGSCVFDGISILFLV